MLAAYLISLIVGGVFVGMSVISGLSKDGDAGMDQDYDHDLGPDGDADLGLDADHELGLDGDADLGLDADHELALDHDVGLDADHHLGGTSLAEAGLAGDERAEPASRRRRRATANRRLWLPFMSFRFWTFGAAFFGLTGTLLTLLALTVEPATLLTSLAMGLGVGVVTATLVHKLRRPVSGDSIARGEYVGQVGVLVARLRPGGTSKVALRIRHREAELLAVSDDARALPADTRVVVLRVDDDGRAIVAPEAAIFGADEPTRAIEEGVV